MNVVIKEDFMPLGTIRTGIKKKRSFGVTIHETGNFSYGSGAFNHRNLQFRIASTGEVGYHYVVDDKESYYLIPEDEICWHAGDGANGRGNTETVGIETCVHQGIDFSKAATNAAEIAADVLRRHGVSKIIDGTKDKDNGNIFQHNTWSSFGKDCPMNIRNNNLWDDFVKMVECFFEGKQVPAFPKIIPKDWSGSGNGESSSKPTPIDKEKSQIYTTIETSKNIGIVPYDYISSTKPTVMNLYGGKTTKGTKICLWEEDNTDDQGFKLVKQSNGSYKIQTARANNKYLQVTSATKGASTVIS